MRGAQPAAFTIRATVGRPGRRSIASTRSPVRCLGVAGAAPQRWFLWRHGQHGAESLHRACKRATVRVAAPSVGHGLRRVSRARPVLVPGEGARCRQTLRGRSMARKPMSVIRAAMRVPGSSSRQVRPMYPRDAASSASRLLLGVARSNTLRAAAVQPTE